MARIAGLILLLLTLVGPMTTPESVLAFDSPLEPVSYTHLRAHET